MSNKEFQEKRIKNLGGRIVSELIHKHSSELQDVNFQKERGPSPTQRPSTMNNADTPRKTIVSRWGTGDREEVLRGSRMEGTCAKIQESEWFGGGRLEGLGVELSKLWKKQISNNYIYCLMLQNELL